MLKTFVAVKVQNIVSNGTTRFGATDIENAACRTCALQIRESVDCVVLITTKSGSDQSGTSHVTYNFRLTNQMLGKKAEIFETQEYIDYQTYIGQLDQTTLDAVWDGQEHNWFDAVFAPSWSQQHSLTFSGGNNKGHFFTSLK